MHEDAADTPTFLEPVYLNEKMVLNCAAYVFEGYSLESEAVDRGQIERSKSLMAGFSFLEKLISFSGEGQSKQLESTENRWARRYTVGGLHMSLIDQLRPTMLKTIDPNCLESDLTDSPSYVEMPSTLRPIDFYALLDTARIVGPIVGEIMRSFVKPWYENNLKAKRTQGGNANQDKSRKPGDNRKPSNELTDDKFYLFLKGTDSYLTALESVLKQLEDDYRRSKQVEMVMWSPGDHSRPYGVLDLDLGDYESEELRSKLSGGNFRVIGKVTRVVRAGESISLLQKSVLFSALSLVNRAIESQGETEGLMRYREELLQIRPVVEQFGLLEVPGPAVRVSAMSVCM